MVWSQQQFGGEFATEHDKEPRSRPFTSHQVTIWPRHTTNVLNLACVVHSSPEHCSCISGYLSTDTKGRFAVLSPASPADVAVLAQALVSSTEVVALREIVDRHAGFAIGSLPIVPVDIYPLVQKEGSQF